MGAALDVSGDRYGRLTATEYVDSGLGGRRWRFRCECGGEIVATLAHVRHGSPASCGCLRRETAATRNAVDLTGQRFDRLLVAERLAPDRHGKVRWRCVCDCGAQATAATNVLRRGEKRSCGCLRRELMAALGRSSKKENPISRTPEYRRALKKRQMSKPERLMQARISRLFRHALAQVNAIKTSRTFDRLGYAPADLVRHIERQFLPGMGWDNAARWEIDHIIPASTAKSEGDVIALNQLSNLRPMWAEANNAKKDRRQHLL